MHKNKYGVGYSGEVVEIRDDWLVLDVGSGHNPHPRANILVDRYTKDDADRAGKPIKMDEKGFVIGDVQFMPFKDKVFDYAIASHIAEHVEEPQKFCKELIRIGKRGYIETPSKCTEIFLGEPVHKWYDYVRNRTLIFEEVTNYMPFGELFYNLFYYDIERAGHKTIKKSNNKIIDLFFRLIYYALRLIWATLMKLDLSFTHFEWDDLFSFKIIKGGEIYEK